MTGLKPRRPFKQRLLEGYERSRLREDVQRARQARLSSARKRYVSAALGATMAITGVGIPLSQGSAGGDGTRSLTADLDAAREFARDANRTIAGFNQALTGTQAISASNMASATDMEAFKESVREEFFRTEVPFGSLIYREALKHDLQPELVAAVVETESRFRPTAKSPVGAVGLMQLMPRTGKWMGASNLLNPTENVQAGTKYLKYLNERFDNHPTNVLAAYNAGEGNVRKFGGVPPFRETRNYVVKVNKSKAELSERINGKVAEALEAEAMRVATR